MARTRLGHRGVERGVDEGVGVEVLGAGHMADVDVVVAREQSPRLVAQGQ
jgi:hypothetical protein